MQVQFTVRLVWCFPVTQLLQRFASSFNGHALIFIIHVFAKRIWKHSYLLSASCFSCSMIDSTADANSPSGSSRK